MPDVSASVQELKAPNLAYFVSLEVDGEKVEVYNAQAEGKVVSGYVEAQFGAEVALCFRNELASMPYDIYQKGYADGSMFDSYFCRAGQRFLTKPVNHPSRIHKMTGTRVSPTEEQHLIFVPVSYTEDDELACRDSTVLDQMGTIKLTLTWGKAAEEPMKQPIYPIGPDQSVPLYGAPEQETKKAKRLGLGPRTDTRPSTYYNFAENDGGVPFAEFRFHYLSKDILKQKGYLPAPPPRPTSPAHSDTSSVIIVDQSEPESDSDLAERIRTQRKRAQDELDQLRELQTQRRAKKNKVSKVAKVEAGAA